MDSSKADQGSLEHSYSSAAYEKTIFSLIHILQALESFINALPDNDFYDVHTFSDPPATLGAHTRHILDRIQNVVNPVLAQHVSNLQLGCTGSEESPTLSLTNAHANPSSNDSTTSDPTKPPSTFIQINYAHRNRNAAEQHSRTAAVSSIKLLERRLHTLLVPNAPSPHTFLCSRDEHPDSRMITTLWNELSQAKSHTIHHCAYMRAVANMEFDVWDGVAEAMGEFAMRFGLDAATPSWRPPVRL